MTIKIVERINEERAKFILSLSEKQRGELIWTKETEKEFNKGEQFLDKKTYLKKTELYLKKQLANDCEVEVEYNFSKEMKTDGRLFTQEFGLQNTKKNLRSFLIGGMFSSDQGGIYVEGGADYCYKDYDMINCHPSILRHMLLSSPFVRDEEHLKTEFPFFEFYSRSSKKRMKFLKMSECSKQEILTMMNASHYVQDANPTTRKIDREFKKIQELFFNQTPEKYQQYEHFKIGLTKNKNGKFLNRLLCIQENKILNLVVDYYKNKYPEQNPISSLMFDGLFISAQLLNQTDLLNNITKKYGVKWDIKEPNTTIEKSSVYENKDGLPEYETLDYAAVKQDFEKKHFMISHPLMFVKEETICGKPIVCTYNQSDFKTEVRPYKYEIFKTKRMEELSIFDTWVSDKDRRSYKKLDFIPTEEKNEEIYNTFQGFHYSKYNNIEFEENDELINIFKKQVGILVDGDEEAVEWVMKYFAHLIQKPEQRPNVAIIFKSGQGYGKDTLLDCISKLLGKEYLYRTAKVDDVFGQFNGAIKNKLLLQLNELEGKDGFSNKEKLKNLITEQATNINEKNMKHYDQSNYLRVIICSNNRNPVEIPTGDRRFAVFDADLRKPSKEHFIKFHDLLQDDNALYTFYKYLKNYDLGTEALHNCRPITNAYKSMRDNSVNPFYVWLKEVLEDYEEMIEHKKHKKTDKVVIKASVLFDDYKEHMDTLQQNMYNFNQKKGMKDLLVSIKVDNIKTKLNGSSVSAYWFDVPITLEYLNDIVKDDEIVEEYTDDDFY